MWRDTYGGWGEGLELEPMMWWLRKCDESAASCLLLDKWFLDMARCNVDDKVTSRTFDTVRKKSQKKTRQGRP